MIFGQQIYKNLLLYLKDIHPTQLETEEVIQNKIIQNVLFKIDTITNKYYVSCTQQQKECLLSKYYDPLSLFDNNFDKFYELLSKHPQYITDNLIEDQNDETEEQTETSDASEPMASTKSEVKNIFSNLFKLTIPQEQKQKQVKQQVEQPNEILLEEIQNQKYCHGFLFQPTYWRLDNDARRLLNLFINQYFNKTQVTENSKYRLSYINSNYHLASTYPSILAIPAAVTDEQLTKAIKFRSKGRVPIISYIDQNNTSLARCSQPGKGFGFMRDSGDEALLYNYANITNNKLIVFDARPKLNAIGNRLTGKGCESNNAYPFSYTWYCNIANIHAVRNSFIAMQNILTNKQFNNKICLLDLQAKQIIDTKMYHHLLCIMQSCNFVKKTMLDAQISCIVHCSDGWDRTSQLSSGTIILIDPYYRTIKGYLQLLQKEWLDFGHMISTRTRGKGSSKAKIDKESQLLKYDSNNISQILLQFIYCTFQLLEKYPDQFQFNKKLLLKLIRELQMQNLTFAFDNQNQRVKSLYYWLIDNLFNQIINDQEKYLNTQYSKNNIIRNIEYPTSYQEIKIFDQYWLLQ